MKKWISLYDLCPVGSATRNDGTVRITTMAYLKNTSDNAQQMEKQLLRTSEYILLRGKHGGGYGGLLRDVNVCAASKITGQAITALYTSLPKVYRQNAVFLMNAVTMNKLRCALGADAHDWITSRRDGSLLLMDNPVTEKDAIFSVCREVLDEVLDTSELDRVATRLQDQGLGMAERVRKLVEENARVRRDQQAYQREYEALAAEHEKLSQQIQAIEEKKKDKVDRRRRIEVFLHLLKEQEECMRFEPYAFVALVDKVIVGQPRTLEFIFRNGRKYEYTMVD